MKIIHITYSLCNGGQENLMVDIANIQQEKGHQVAIIIINNKIESSVIKRINTDIQLFSLKRKLKSKNIFPFIKLFIVLVKLSEYNIIHSHAPNLGMYLKIFTKIPKILTIHSTNFNLLFIKYYDKIYTISNSVKKFVENKSACNAKVIYNGINYKNITSVSSNLNIRNTNKKKFRLVQVARLEHNRKGQDILLNALAILSFKTNDYLVTLDFIGDGPSKNHLKRLSRELIISNRVNFLGDKSRLWIYNHLCEYDLLIQPSRHEGFGLTVAEAMAAKVPVITSNHDGPAELIEYGKYGSMFENENFNDLAKKIKHLINGCLMNKLNPIIEKAYLHCIENYDIERISDKYIMQYHSLINSKRK